MTEKFDYDSYLSVFTWRYGSKEMRKIFSEKNKRKKWRDVWTALAKGEFEYGLLSKKEFLDIKNKSDSKYIDIDKAHKIEENIKHDLMAEVLLYSKQAKIGGGKIHLGATSMDIEDNADMLKIIEALNIIYDRSIECLSSLKEQIEKYSNTPCMGWPHIQTAEPINIVYRFSLYAQDILIDLKLLDLILKDIAHGKGFKGAVGSSASYSTLVGQKNSEQLEDKILDYLNLKSYTITSQIYPRKFDSIILFALSSIAQSLHKFALDMRLLQSPPFGEISEPFGKSQVGSSAMPFKRNPIMLERINSLTRYVNSLIFVPINNSSNMILERTLDDSANRRIVIPEAFLAIDESLLLFNKIIKKMTIHESNVKKNLDLYGPFSIIENILLTTAKHGANRQKMHERLRVLSMKAWKEIEDGKPNNLLLYVENDKLIQKYKINFKLLKPENYVGNIKMRTKKFLSKDLNPIIKKHMKNS